MGIYILDSSAFMNLNQLEELDGEKYTVEEVKNEIKDFKSKALFTIAEVKIGEPEKESIEIVKKFAENSGDIGVMSKTDIKIVALAVDFEGIVVSDDFDIQNVCQGMGIDYKSASGKKISYEFRRKLYCDSCKKVREGKKCHVCGEELRPKIVSKKRI